MFEDTPIFCEEVFFLGMEFKNFPAYHQFFPIIDLSLNSKKLKLISDLLHKTK